MFKVSLLPNYSSDCLVPRFLGTARTQQHMRQVQQSPNLNFCPNYELLPVLSSGVHS